MKEDNKSKIWALADYLYRLIENDKRLLVKVKSAYGIEAYLEYLINKNGKHGLYHEVLNGEHLSQGDEINACKLAFNMIVDNYIVNKKIKSIEVEVYNGYEGGSSEEMERSIRFYKNITTKYKDRVRPCEC
ncbi:hypothetical protein [Pantoea agglomerans]|uniref:hypothetical protein n=1 Tax=Enterobacter agglomerans TaxID=549 RepID=UPI003C7A689B